MKKVLIILFFIAFFIGDITFIFSNKGNENNQKYRPFPVPVSYKLNNEQSSNNSFREADIIFSGFLKKHKIKGASIAIAKNGKLVMAKGYGLANAENNEVVEPKHLFRIASVSKLLTAVAIMKLVEDKKISIEDKVFGPNGILNDSIFLNYTDNRIEKITIHNLLNHTGGWSRRRPDPMFNYFGVARDIKVSLPLNSYDVVQYALKQNLDYQPGTKHSYSNLGYGILGIVIEKLSGKDYEQFVKREILYPLGIYDMHIARSFYYQRFTNEVSYYDGDNLAIALAFDGSGEYVPKVYGGNDMHLIAATGGWLASPTELMKFILAIDGFESRPDILSPETIKMMVKYDKFGPFGWKGAHNGFWWRTGTLSGTSALVARQNNEICWIAIFNTSTSRPTKFPRYIHRTFNNMLSTVKVWPEYDLFSLDVKQKNSLFAVN